MYAASCQSFGTILLPDIDTISTMPDLTQDHMSANALRKPAHHEAAHKKNGAVEP